MLVELPAGERLFDGVMNVVIGHAVRASRGVDLRMAPIVLRNERVEKRAPDLGRLSIAFGEEWEERSNVMQARA